MKHIFVLFVILIAVNLTTAQIPQTISWQGILKNAQGELLNGDHDITVKLFDSATDGTCLWSETHENITITDGITSMILGSIIDLNLTFDSQYWLEITIDDGTPLTRIMLTSAPYAMYAKNAPNELTGVPLILKDIDGNMRMRFNPDEGNFEMFDEEEELWYSITVSSPPIQRQFNNDGTQSVQSNNNYYIYDQINNLMHSDIKIFDAEEGGVMKRFQINYVRDEDGEIVEVIERFFINGELVNQKKWEMKGLELKLVDEWKKEGFNETTTRNLYDDDGNLAKTIYNENYNNLNTEYNYVYSSNRAIMEGADGSKNEHYNTQRIDFDMEDGITKYRWDTYKPSNGEYSFTRTKTIGTRTTTTISQTQEGYSGNVYFPRQNTVTDLDGSHTEYNDETGTNMFQSSTEVDRDAQTIKTTVSTPVGTQSTSITQGTDEITVDGDVVVDGSFSANESFFDDLDVNNDVTIEGNLNVQGTKSFRIDHPSDNNKYLQHACMESNEVLNTYSGNVTTDDDGFATVTLPDYFDEINTDFRYVLTVVGTTFARAIVYSEIEDNEFQIRTDEANTKVSWMVIAKRNDTILQDNPFYDEIDK